MTGLVTAPARRPRTQLRRQPPARRRGRAASRSWSRRRSRRWLDGGGGTVCRTLPLQFAELFFEHLVGPFQLAQPLFHGLIGGRLGGRLLQLAQRLLPRPALLVLDLGPQAAPPWP